MFEPLAQTETHATDCMCRAGRQREFAKEEQEKFAAKAVAADAAATPAVGSDEGWQAPAEDGWGDALGGAWDDNAPGVAPPQAPDHTHKRQQHPRGREQVAKRGRNRGPASRPGSATSKAKQEASSISVPGASTAGTAPVAAPAHVSDSDAFAPAPSAPPLPQGQFSSASDAAAPNPAFTWGNNDSAAQVAPSIAQLKLDTPVSLQPVLDPVARQPGVVGQDGLLPDLRGFQIERPNNAKVAAVSRPRSANAVSDPFSASANTDLPNGMPPLPADLTFDSVLDKPSMGDSTSKGPSINFGHMQPPQPNQAMDRLHPGAFPAALFPITSQGSNRSGAMWQQPPLPEQAPNPQPSLAAAVESFYSARAVGGTSSGFGSTGSAAFSGGPTTNPANNPPLNLPQFGSFGAGSFGTGLQFGQLGGAFGQSPFIPTGKQPDWSTGPIPGNPNPAPQPSTAFPSRPPNAGSIGPFNGRNPSIPNGTAPGSGVRQGRQPTAGPLAGTMQPSTPATFTAAFDAAAGLPDDVFDEPKQVAACRSAPKRLTCNVQSLMGQQQHKGNKIAGPEAGAVLTSMLPS